MWEASKPDRTTKEVLMAYTAEVDKKSKSQ